MDCIDRIEMKNVMWVREGDVLARQAINKSMETLGKALAMIACVLNP